MSFQTVHQLWQPRQQLSPLQTFNQDQLHKPWFQLTWMYLITALKLNAHWLSALSRKALAQHPQQLLHLRIQVRHHIASHQSQVLILEHTRFAMSVQQQHQLAHLQYPWRKKFRLMFMLIAQVRWLTKGLRFQESCSEQSSQSFHHTKMCSTTTHHQTAYWLSVRSSRVGVPQLDRPHITQNWITSQFQIHCRFRHKPICL